MTEFRIGDKIVFEEQDSSETEWIDITIGKTYVIAGTDEGGDLYFIDDAGEENFSIGPSLEWEDDEGNLHTIAAVPTKIN